MALKTTVWVQYLEWPPDGIQSGRVGAPTGTLSVEVDADTPKTRLPAVDLEDLGVSVRELRVPVRKLKNTICHI